jgi:hypothetical protein
MPPEELDSLLQGGQMVMRFGTDHHVTIPRATSRGKTAP